MLIAQSCPTLRDPMDLAPRLLCPGDSPGKNTGVGCLAHLADPMMERGSPALQADSSRSEPPGKLGGRKVWGISTI